MRCPRCEFENLPGQAACFRCGSVLTAGVAVDVHPPRATGWGKCADGVRRWGRRTFRRDAVKEREIPAEVSWSGHVLAHLLLAPVPGLLHLYQGRFRGVWYWSVFWFLLMGGAVYFYGLSTGLFLIGLAAGIHGWVLGQAWGVIDRKDELFSRLGAIFGMMLFAVILYWLVGRGVANRFPGGNTPLAVPGLKVEVGDYLIGRPLSASAGVLARGSFVLYLYPEMDRARTFFIFTPDVTVGQVIGRPGETVTLTEGVFYVSQRRLDPRVYPVPDWLRGLSASFLVPQDGYFVSTAYRLSLYHGGQLTRGIAEPRCLVNAQRIRGYLMYRWLPMGRRGWIPIPADPVYSK